jgi:RHS repeat-associated protein
MKVSYEERLAIDFGLHRRCDEGNDVVLSVRAGGNPGQLFCSETLTSVDRLGDNNRLLNDGTHTYTYDFEGNRTKKTVTATGEATEYQWDHHNRLVRVTHLDSVGDPVQTLDYIYDVLDRRIGKTDTPAVGPGYTERYVYDGEHLALKFGASALANRYLHGPVIDQILADEQVSSLSSPGDVLWPMADHLGTVRDLAEYDSGTGDTVIVNRISYDAYGGSRAETNAAVDHLFGYTGREWDAEADLQYNRARWYDPAVGRWLSEDPIGFEAGDANLSRYVGNRSTIAVDPSGLAEIVTQLPLTPRGSWNPTLPDDNIFGIRPPRVGEPAYSYQNFGMYYQPLPPTTRPFTSGESDMLTAFFSTYLDQSGLVIGIGGLNRYTTENTMVPRYTPWFPPRNYVSDFSLGTPNQQRHFIHEMMHVLQSQNGNFN